jgi:hypothetical protein
VYLVCLEFRLCLAIILINAGNSEYFPFLLLQVPGARQHYLSIRPDQGIVFPSVSYIRNLISKAAVKQGKSKMIVVIDCSHMSQADFTAADSFRAMLADFQARHQPVYWQAANQGVIATLRAIAGENIKVIQGPIELASTKQESPKLGLGTITEMVTISEEAPESAVLGTNIPNEVPTTPSTETAAKRRFIISPGDKVQIVLKYR